MPQSSISQVLADIEATSITLNAVIQAAGGWGSGQDPAWVKRAADGKFGSGSGSSSGSKSSASDPVSSAPSGSKGTAIKEKIAQAKKGAAQGVARAKAGAGAAASDVSGKVSDLSDRAGKMAGDAKAKASSMGASAVTGIKSKMGAAHMLASEAMDSQKPEQKDALAKMAGGLALAVAGAVLTGQTKGLGKKLASQSDEIAGLVSKALKSEAGAKVEKKMMAERGEEVMAGLKKQKDSVVKDYEMAKGVSDGSVSMDDFKKHMGPHAGQAESFAKMYKEDPVALTGLKSRADAATRSVTAAAAANAERSVDSAKRIASTEKEAASAIAQKKANTAKRAAATGAGVVGVGAGVHGAIASVAGAAAYANAMVPKGGSSEA